MSKAGPVYHIFHDSGYIWDSSSALFLNFWETVTREGQQQLLEREKICAPFDEALAVQAGCGYPGCEPKPVRNP